MSPHAVVVPEYMSLEKGDFWKEFGITKNGFLPSEAPLARLSSPYYEPWESIAEKMVQTLQDGSFRGHIDKLTVLSVDGLVSEEEYQRAYIVLTFFVHAYIWGGDTASEVLRHSLHHCSK